MAHSVILNVTLKKCYLELLLILRHSRLKFLKMTYTAKKFSFNRQINF